VTDWGVTHQLHTAVVLFTYLLRHLVTHHVCRHSATSSLRLSATSTPQLRHPTASPLRHSATPPLHHSATVTPPLSLRHSVTQPLRHSATPPLRHRQTFPRTVGRSVVWSFVRWSFVRWSLVVGRSLVVGAVSFSNSRSLTQRPSPTNVAPPPHPPPLTPRRIFFIPPPKFQIS